jgi:hypothetical protein
MKKGLDGKNNYDVEVSVLYFPYHFLRWLL